MPYRNELVVPGIKTCDQERAKWDCLTNRKRVCLVCSLVDNDIRHHRGQSWCGLTKRIRVSPQQILTTVMTNIVVDNSRQR